MDKKWGICVAFTSVIVVVAIVVPLVMIMQPGAAKGGGADLNLQAEQGAALSDKGHTGVSQGGSGAAGAVAAAPNGGAMAPSEMVVQFGGMIDCMVQRGSLAYNGYGCYCGIGGSGKAVDATDRCCQQHDECYRRSKRQGVCKGDSSVYLTWYKVSMTQCDTPNAKIHCASHHRYSFFDSLLAGKQSRCAVTLCHCDRTAALCFARHHHSYNLNYASYQGKNMC